MTSVYRLIILFGIFCVSAMAVAQNHYPICSPQSQKSSTWNQCIGDFIFPNGIKYIGLWKNDKTGGEGMLIYPNENIFVGSFANNMAIGWGALIDKSGRIIKSGYANSGNVGEQGFLRSGDSFITEEDGSYSTTIEYVRLIQKGLENYASIPAISLEPSEFRVSRSTNTEYSSNSKSSQKKQKCLRLGLNPGSDDFKTCMQQ